METMTTGVTGASDIDQSVFADYITTANSMLAQGKTYADVDPLFTEFSGFDDNQRQELRRYVDEYNKLESPASYAEVLNPNFPSLFGEQKKKDQASGLVPLDGTASSVGSPSSLPDASSRSGSAPSVRVGDPEPLVSPTSLSRMYQDAGYKTLSTMLDGVDDQFMQSMSAPDYTRISMLMNEVVSGSMNINDAINLTSKSLRSNRALSEMLGIEQETEIKYGVGLNPGVTPYTVQKEDFQIEAETEKALKKYLTDQAYAGWADNLLNQLPEDKRNDTQYLKDLEQKILEEQAIKLDLTGDDEVGNTPFLDANLVYGAGMKPSLQFSGYLVDKAHAAGLDLINGFAYMANGFSTEGTDIVKRREEAEELRDYTLQFVDGMTEGDFENGMKQLLGGFAEAAPTLSVVLPAAMATGGLGLGAYWTTGLIAFESASVTTAQEAARIADNPEWNRYLMNGKSYSYQEAMAMSGGNKERMLQFAVDENFSGKAGYLANVFGSSFVADGFSTLAFMRGLRSTSKATLMGGGGRDMAQWWQYNLLNTGISVPVGGLTGSLAGMQQYMASMDAQGIEYTWDDVRQHGIDMALQGSAMGGAMSVGGGMLNLALASDPVGRGGGNLRFVLEEQALLKQLADATPEQRAFLNQQYEALLNKNQRRRFEDQDFYSEFSDADVQQLYSISVEQNKLMRDMMKGKPQDPAVEQMAKQFDQLQQERMDLENAYGTEKPYAEEIIYDTAEDGTRFSIISPVFKNPDPDHPDNILIANRPEGSRFVRGVEVQRNIWKERLLDTFEMMRGLQRKVERQQEGGDEGRRVAEDADIDVKLRLMDSRTAVRFKDAIREREKSGLNKDVANVEKVVAKDLETHQSLLPETVELNGMNLLGRYMYALHAPERNAHIAKKHQAEVSELQSKNKLSDAQQARLDQLQDFLKVRNGSGMSDADAQAFLDALPAKTRESLDKALPKVRKIQQQTRDMLFEAGIYSKEMYDATNSTFQNYIPLHGLSIDETFLMNTNDALGNTVARQDDPAYSNAPRSIDMNGKYWYEATGRGTETGDIYGKIIAQNANAIMLAERNRVGQSVLEFVRKYPFDPSEKEPYYRELGAKEKAPDSNVLTVYEDGVARRIYFKDSDIIEQWSNGTGRQVEDMWGFVDSWTSTLGNFRNVHTTYSPEFGLKNFTRDAQTALIHGLSHSQREFGYALFNEEGQKVNTFQLEADFVKSLPQAVRYAAQNEIKLGTSNTEMGRLFQEWRMAGGETGWAFMDDFRKQLKVLRDETDPKKRNALVTKMMASPANPLNIVKGANASYENGIRFASYVAARRQGVSKDRAAALSKVVSVDFNRKGTWAKQLGGLMYFYNATAQGIDQSIGTMTNPRSVYSPSGEGRSVLAQFGPQASLFGGMVTGGAFLTMFNEMVSDVDDTGRSHYSKIPDYEKKMFQIIMIPGTNEYVKLPKAYGYGQFLDIGVAIGEVGMGIRDEKAAAWYIASAIQHNLSPVHGTAKQEDKAKQPIPGMSALAQTGRLAVPDALEGLFIDVPFNTTSFGGQVYGDYENRSRSSVGTTDNEIIDQFFRDFNEAGGGSKYLSGDKLGFTTDVPTDLVGHLAQYYLGGMYSFLDRSERTVKDWRALQAAGIDIEDAPKGMLDARNTPFLRDFYGSTYNDIMSRYYNMKDLYSPLYKEWNDKLNLRQTMMQNLPDRLGGKGEWRYGDAKVMEPLVEKVDRASKALYMLRNEAIKDKRLRNVTAFSSDEDLAYYAKAMRDIEAKEANMIMLMGKALEKHYLLTPEQKYAK